MVFDLDGTLVRSKHDYREMSRKVEDILRDAGVLEGGVSQPRRIWQIIRRGEEGMDDLGINREDRKGIHERITEALNAVELLALDTVEPMTGSLETLRAVKELGLRIGVATRAGSPYAKRCLEITDLDGYVDALLARDEVDHPKPDPRHLLQVIDALGSSPHKVVYIGDTTTDLTTAMAADISFIGYASNEERAKRMREAGCEVFVSDLREIIDIIVG